MIKSFNPKIREEEIRIYFVPIKKTDKTWSKGFWIIKLLINEGS